MFCQTNLFCTFAKHICFVLVQNTYILCHYNNTYILCFCKTHIFFYKCINFVFYQTHILCVFVNHIYFVFFSGLEVAHDQIRNPLDCSWIEWLKLIKMAKRLDGWQDLKKRADRSSCPGRPIRCRIKPRHPQMDETMYFFKPWSSGGPHLLSLH